MYNEYIYDISQTFTNRDIYKSQYPQMKILNKFRDIKKIYITSFNEKSSLEFSSENIAENSPWWQNDYTLEFRIKTIYIEIFERNERGSLDATFYRLERKRGRNVASSCHIEFQWWKQGCAQPGLPITDFDYWNCHRRAIAFHDKTRFFHAKVWI